MEKFLIQCQIIYNHGRESRLGIPLAELSSHWDWAGIGTGPAEPGLG